MRSKKPIRVTNARTDGVLADRCAQANSVLGRGVGLLNRSSLDAGEGLLIRPCSSVHCFFMRFPIDVIFLDGDGKVLKMYAPLKQWRASRWVRGAKQTLELPAGTIAATETCVGDTLLLEQ